MTQPAYEDLGVLQYETASMDSSTLTREHNTDPSHMACYSPPPSYELMVAQPQLRAQDRPGHFKPDSADVKRTDPQPWKHRLCGCCAKPCHPGLFFNAYFCPCIVYGRINYRDRHGNDMTDYHCISDGSTWFFCIATYFEIQPILTFMQLRKIRSKYNIAGGGFTDCLQACYCQCCSLIRTDKEMRDKGSKGAQIHTQQYENQDVIDVVPQSDGAVGEIELQRMRRAVEVVAQTGVDA